MSQEANEKPIGHISHFFGKINVGIVVLDSALHVGDKIHVKGHTTDFVQTINSMQNEHEPVRDAKSGESVGIKVDEHVREGDTVYLAS